MKEMNRVLNISALTSVCVGLASSFAAQPVMAQTAPFTPPSVDHDICLLSYIRCVGAGAEYDTSDRVPEEAFREVIADTMPGDTIKIYGGIYRHDPETAASNTFWRINRSGTAESPIIIEPFNREPVVFEGFGFSEDTDRPARTDERIISVSGDHIALRGIEIRNASRWGLVVSSSNGIYEDLTVHDSWDANIILLAYRDMHDNTFRHIETFRSRHGAGISIRPSNASVIGGTTVEYSLAYRNGYQANGEKSPSVSGDPKGGGNSDGVSMFKTCHSKAYQRSMLNLCPDTYINANIVWGNADDGVDISGAVSNVVSNNIAFDNGPEGNRGFKVFSLVDGGLTFFGNIGMLQSGFAFELQFDQRGHVVNNTSIRNQANAFDVIYQDAIGGQAVIANNLAAGNVGNYDWRLREAGERGGVSLITNHFQGVSGDPLVSNLQLDPYAIIERGMEFSSAREKVHSIAAEFRHQLAPAASSPLIDAGSIIEGVHCAEPSVDIQFGHRACVQWTGAAPDIGAVEYSIE